MQAAYSLFSSSSGNCFFLKDGDDELLIDVGASCKAIGESLRTLGTSFENIKAIFITHEHSDHIKGLATICKKYEIPIFCAVESARYICENIVSARTRIKLMELGETVNVGDISVTSSKTPHDSLESVCYRIRLSDGNELGYATDVGCLSRGVVETLCGCRYVVIESNHDKGMLMCSSYPKYLKKRILGKCGHLSNDDCSRLLPLLAEHGCRRFLLAHLSQENNTPEIAFSFAKKQLEDAGYEVGASVTIDVAKVNSPVALFCVE